MFVDVESVDWIDPEIDPRPQAQESEPPFPSDWLRIATDGSGHAFYFVDAESEEEDPPVWHWDEECSDDGPELALPAPLAVPDLGRARGDPLPGRGAPQRAPLGPRGTRPEPPFPDQGAPGSPGARPLGSARRARGPRDPRSRGPPDQRGQRLDPDAPRPTSPSPSSWRPKPRRSWRRRPNGRRTRQRSWPRAASTEPGSWPTWTPSATS